MKAVLLGTGAVGSRAARQLVSTPGLEQLTVVDHDQRRAEQLAAALATGDVVHVVKAARGEVPLDALRGAQVLLLATPAGQQVAEAALTYGVNVVSTCDDPDEIRQLLALDGPARAFGLTVVAGAAFAPGLTCVLARHASTQFERVEEIHIASFGTGGPACARRHHAALASDALDWWDGAWRQRPGGSGRELCWFPDPVGAADCYRAAMPDALLLVPAFPDAQRIVARMAASRRDRLTAWLPMLRPPHPEGLLGAVRVEVRGRRGRTYDAQVLGAIDRPALAAGTVAALASIWAASGKLARTGAGGLAQVIDDPVPFLRELARRGVRAAAFEGSAAEETGTG